MAMLLKLMLFPLVLFIQIGVAESIISDSSLTLQLDQLNSKISLLVSRIDEKTSELRKKDKRIKELESTIDLQLARSPSLQSELQEKGSLELVAKPNVRATELERQIDVLRRALEAQNKKKDTLRTRTNVAEEKIQELNLKLESLQKINEEQNARIRKTKRALQVAEEEMMKAKLEASSVSKQLEEVKEGWLPPWLAVQLSIVMTYWNEHGRPSLNRTVEKALETKSEAVKLVETHIHSFKTKWIPAMKERSVEFARDAGPQIQRFKTKIIDLYHTSKQYMEPHIVKAQEEARKFTDPYVDQVSVVMKPHIDKARILFQPYTEKVPHHYRKVKKIVSLYHHQAEENIHQMLRNHNITKPYATKQLAWYLASALLLALPVVFLLNLALALDFMCEKPKKHSRKHHTSHTHRRAKRAHPGK